MVLPPVVAILLVPYYNSKVSFDLTCEFGVSCNRRQHRATHGSISHTEHPLTLWVTASTESVSVVFFALPCALLCSVWIAPKNHPKIRASDPSSTGHQ